MASESEPRKFFEAPEVTFWGSKCFILQFQYKKTLANCNKASINNFKVNKCPGGGRSLGLLPYRPTYSNGNPMGKLQV